MAIQKKPNAKPAAVASRAPARPTARAAAQPATARAAEPDEQLVPMNVLSSGLVDDIDGTVTDVAAVEWDMNGKAPLGPYLAVEWTDPNGAAHVEYYSNGTLQDWRAAKSGRGFVAASGKTMISQVSNLGYLLESLRIAGFPQDDPNLAAGDLQAALTGLKAHVLRKSIERKGLVRRPSDTDRQSAGPLLVTKIIQLPTGDEVAASVAAKTTAASSKGNSHAEAATVEASDMDTQVVGALVAALSEEGVEAIDKKQISKIVFQTFTEAGATPVERSKAIVRCGQQEFLKSLAEQGIEYDGAQIRWAQTQ